VSKVWSKLSVLSLFRDFPALTYPDPKLEAALNKNNGGVSHGKDCYIFNFISVNITAR